MSSITISQISAFLGTLVAFIGAIEYLIVRVNKVFKKGLEPINNRINELELQTDKNFLVRFLADIENGQPIDEVEKEHFYKTYEAYHKLGGNSYIDHKVEKLQKENKL